MTVALMITAIYVKQWNNSCSLITISHERNGQKSKTLIYLKSLQTFSSLVADSIYLKKVKNKQTKSVSN